MKTSTIVSVLYDLTKCWDCIMCIKEFQYSLFCDQILITLRYRSFIYIYIFLIFQFPFELSVVLSLGTWKSWCSTGQMCTSMFNDLVRLFYLSLFGISWEELMSMHFWWSIWWKNFVNFFPLPYSKNIFVQTWKTYISAYRRIRQLMGVGSKVLELNWG